VCKTIRAPGQQRLVQREIAYASAKRRRGQRLQPWAVLKQVRRLLNFHFASLAWRIFAKGDFSAIQLVPAARTAVWRKVSGDPPAERPSSGK